MEKNFEIQYSVILLFGQLQLDLHNDYDFAGLTLSTKNQTTTLQFDFVKSKGDWVAADRPTIVKMFFNQVSFFSLSDDFFEDSQKIIESIGYKECNDPNDGWLMDEIGFNENCHIIFVFESNQYIRLFCNDIIISTQ